MCESSVWLQYPDGRTEKIADNVLIVTQEGPQVVLRWFLAEPRRVAGRIHQVDAIKHIITLDVTEAPTLSTAQTEMASSSSGAEMDHPHVHPHPH
jgi:predicted RNA-binding protein